MSNRLWWLPWLVGLAIALLVAPGYALVQNQWSYGVGPPALQPLGVPPPTGFHWQVVFNDDFTKDTSLNSVFTVIQGGSGTVNLDPTNGLQIIGANCGGTNQFGCTRVGVCRSNVTGACQQTSGAGFRFGYWEFVARLPETAGGAANGTHSDIWMRSADTGQTEADITEAFGNGNPSNATYTYYNVGDRLTNNPITSVNFSEVYPKPSVGDLGAAFHTYGFRWDNTGAPAGSISHYFDGMAQDNPYQFQGGLGWTTENIAEKMTVDMCYTTGYQGGATDCTLATSNNPLAIQRETIWQLVAN